VGIKEHLRGICQNGDNTMNKLYMNVDVDVGKQGERGEAKAKVSSEQTRLRTKNAVEC
jgi:hypothetical protein